MKNLLLLSLFAISTIFVACGDDEEEDLGLTPGENGLTATITGDISVNFDATGNIAGQQLTNVTVVSNTLSIVATNTTGSGISIAISSYSGDGTYSLDLGEGNIASYSSVDINNPTDVRGYIAISGEVVITVSGNEISGTFNWVGEGDNDQDGNNESISVTGQFLVIPA